MLIGFLPNKERIRGARANPMYFHSLGELASEESSESGRQKCPHAQNYFQTLGWKSGRGSWLQHGSTKVLWTRT